MVVRSEARMSQPVARAPRLTAASSDMVREVEVLDECGERRMIDVPSERPLTIFVDGLELVTLMTLGASPELLVLGYLRNQRLIAEVTEIESVEVDWHSSAARVMTRQGARPFSPRAAGPVAITGCGLGTVFGGLVNRIGSVGIACPVSSAWSR